MPCCQCNVGAYRNTAIRSCGLPTNGTVKLSGPVVFVSRYSPANFGGRLAKVAEIPSDRSFDGRNAAFHAAT